MEEELNENELEEKFYSMLHYADDSQTQQGKVDLSENVVAIIDNPPRSAVRRYWRTNERDNIYQKVNTPKAAPQPPPPAPADKPKPKEEKNKLSAPTPPPLSLFQSPVPQNTKNKIEIIDHEDTGKVLELVTSDEDEVVEVALPPKPTITIDSSDEEELAALPQSPPTKHKKQTQASKADREVSASPVPSVVSSVSDEFIRGDCIALKISSHQPDHHSFDFSLHGSDLICSTPSKKKKKKKYKEVSSTPNESTPNSSAVIEELFATPKSKAKNKKQKIKPFSVTDVQPPDVYDSDSNQSNINLNKSRSSYTVTEKSMPSVDVYESDSNMSDTVKESEKSNKKLPNTAANINSSHDSIKKAPAEISNVSKNSSAVTDSDANITIDLTGNISVPNYTADIEENIVIGNISGFTECDDYEDKTPAGDVNKFCSTKVPAILNENLDFDNLKGKDKVCKNRRYSLTSFREEMEKFYNESWGGEDFNHRELQKNMSRDKSLWAIDPKDRMPSIGRKKPICTYCSRPGHRDDMCRMKPSVCYMCGQPGHMEPRCPTKICVNCGSPNRLYSTMCRRCCSWPREVCAQCGQRGHPASHCPDLWRRYHNTIDITPNLVKNQYLKKHYQLFCSGCTRRGHLVHTCRNTLPFSGLPINSPYVCMYTPLFGNQSYNHEQPNFEPPWRNEGFHYNQSGRQNSYYDEINEPPVKHDRKRHSKSPIVHDTQAKKRNLSCSSQTGGGDSELRQPDPAPKERKNSQNQQNDSNVPTESNEEVIANSNNTEEKAPDYIPIGSTNRDKKGQIIQDNEVSDSSDVVTSARIYITNDIIDKLKTDEGEKWLQETTEKHEIIAQNSEIASFLSIKGKLKDQEAFQSALRDWTNKSKEIRKTPDPDSSIDHTGNNPENSQFPSNNIPKNRNNVLRKINNALDLLKGDLGEPNELYKELTYLQNRHQQLMKQKVVSPAQLSNNREHINEKFKKLNMVLLGQAGLADGARHICELHSLQQRLVNFRQKNIPVDMRKEIGQHYHSIFTTAPREDYGELIDTYNVNTKHQTYNKKKKDKSFKMTPKKKSFNSIPPQQQKSSVDVHPLPAPANPRLRQRLVEKTMNKLVFFHRRLLRTRLSDAALKKTKIVVMRKLHTHIASLNKNDNVNLSSKSLKKMKKLQGQAQWLLSNEVL